MPTLTRRRSPDGREEWWQVFYGDVRVGTIAKRVGIPNNKPRWGWSCGFYPDRGERMLPDWARGCRATD